MRKTRTEVFETNSSSTHCLTTAKRNDNYVPQSSKIVIEFISTDDYYCLSSLKEKVSYLVSYIVHQYQYDVRNYQELVEEVEEDYDFKKIVKYVLERYGKEVVLPTDYEGDIEYITEINHQLISDNFNDFLRDICDYDRNYLAEILAVDKKIEFGRD